MPSWGCDSPGSEKPGTDWKTGRVLGILLLHQSRGSPASPPHARLQRCPGRPADCAGGHLQVCFPGGLLLPTPRLPGRWAGKPTALPTAHCSNGEKREGARARPLWWGPEDDRPCGLGIHVIRFVPTEAHAFQSSEGCSPSPTHREDRPVRCWAEQKLLLKGHCGIWSLKEPSGEPTQMSESSCTRE